MQILTAFKNTRRKPIIFSLKHHIALWRYEYEFHKKLEAIMLLPIDIKYIGWYNYIVRLRPELIR